MAIKLCVLCSWKSQGSGTDEKLQGRSNIHHYSATKADPCHASEHPFVCQLRKSEKHIKETPLNISLEAPETEQNSSFAPAIE